jgi:hypothetical protein
MYCLVTAGKHINDIRDIAGQPSITTIEGLWEAVFSVGSAPRLYSEHPRPAECSLVEFREVKSWLVSELVRELQFSPCDLLLFEAGS